MNRRQFFQRAGRLMGGLAGIASLGTAHLSLSRLPPVAGGRIDPHDEAFWSQVRAQFPLTRERIYLNTGGLGPSPYPVLETVRQKMQELERISETGHSEELWLQIKSACAGVLGCAAEQIAFTRNATEGINIVCNGLPFERGDEVITSTHEHVGNTIAWLARQQRDGIRMRVFTPSMESPQANLDRIERLVTPRTRALSLMHVSTATGHILPLREIGELARRHGLWYFVDGAQAAGMMPVDVQQVGCDAYATSGHKWLLGPKGTGLLYVRPEMLETIRAKWVGAYSNIGAFDMASGVFQFYPGAQRYEYGTVNVPLVAGLGAAADFLLAIGMENVWQRNLALIDTLKKGLADLGVDDLSPVYAGGYGAMRTFRLPGMPREQLQAYLAREHRLRTRGIYEGGLQGIRISLHIFNSFAEVNRILEGVAAARKL